MQMKKPQWKFSWVETTHYHCKSFLWSTLWTIQTMWNFYYIKKTPQTLTTYNSTKLLGCQIFKKKKKKKKLSNVSKLLKEKNGHQKMWN